MPHDIHQMVYVGTEPWHGLGTPLPANGSYEEIVQAAGFYTAVERPLHSPPMEDPIPDKRALFREDTGDYLSTVSTGYEVVQFEEVARTLVEAVGGVGCIDIQESLFDQIILFMPFYGHLAGVGQQGS